MNMYMYMYMYMLRTAAPPLGPQLRVPEPVPSLETHLKSE